MKAQFFPKNKQFWIYHASVIFLLTLVEAAFTLSNMTGALLIFNLIGWLLIILFYSLAMLVFRKIYLQRKWQNYNTFRTMLQVCTYALLTGTLVTAITFSIIVPLFWNSLFSPEIVSKMNITPAKALTITYFSNVLAISAYACLWIFIYISITTNRRIKETELINLRLENHLKEAQLHSLANQLNPHFLFNSLNNIRFMVHENSERADRMIVNLSDILRYSLETSKQDKVVLAKELDIINHYIALIKIQFEERLQFNCLIGENLEDCLIPPMTLQLLIENAIKHGIDQLRRGGKLTLIIKEQTNKLIISLTNDLPEQKMEPEGTGIGLKNIAKRLHLLYNLEAQLRHTIEDHQFVVTISLPKEN